ncbi:MAG: hypothetical protein ACLU8Z_03175 [Dorea sp.]
MIENMKVRRFKEEDAQEVRNLIVRNFLEVNSKDYGISAMEKLAKPGCCLSFSVEYVD